MTTETQGKAYFVWINLAHDEWGNELMERVAREYFDAHPEYHPLIVHVGEHAGWYLEFARDGMIVGTANDGAILDPKVKAFFDDFESRELVQLPAIRRQSARKEAS